MEISERLYQMFHLDNRLCLLLCRNDSLTVIMTDARRAKYLLELLKYHLRRSNPPHFSLIQKSHALTASDLVEIRCRGHDGDTALLEHQQHLPQFLAAHRVHSRRRLVKQQHTRLMHQRATQRQFLLHTA